MKRQSLLLAKVLLMAVPVVCQNQPDPEYQQNSAQIALTLNGHQGDAFSPASDVAWLGGQATVRLEVSSPVAGVTLLAYEAASIISRTQGAYVTSAGQLINLAMGPSLITADVTSSLVNGVLQLNVPTSAAGIFAFQALVVDLNHPDGFRLSAPVILRVSVPTHTYLRGAVDLGSLASNSISIVEALGITFSDTVFGIGEVPTYAVKGTVTLTSPSVGSLTQSITVDGTGKQVLLDGSTVSTLYDLFPLAIAEAGQVEFSFDSPVSVAVSNMYLAPLPLTTYKTDKGRVVATGPYPFPTYTSQQALQSIDAQSPGLSSRITEVAAPSPNYWCHSFTFLPAGANTGLFGSDVDKILSDNNYHRSDAIPFRERVGDVVVYRDAQGNVLHTGVVVETDGIATATKIRSKWGPLGTYDHAPGDVPPGYKPPGGHIEYWSTDRAGGNTLKDP